MAVHHHHHLLATHSLYAIYQITYPTHSYEVVNARKMIDHLLLPNDGANYHVVSVIIIQGSSSIHYIILSCKEDDGCVCYYKCYFCNNNIQLIHANILISVDYIPNERID